VENNSSKRLHFSELSNQKNLLSNFYQRFVSPPDYLSTWETDASVYQKTEICLKKKSNISWPTLENSELIESLKDYLPKLTFDAGGRRGTYGAKEQEMVLDSVNSSH
jgi:hypothetical protein